MTMYNVNGSNVMMMNDMDLDLQDTLPVAVYNVRKMPMGGPFYLQRGADLDLPGKIYGDAKSRADRILHTFKDRAGTTGVLLSGLKGSGKSLTMKVTAVNAMKEGFPVIIIDEPYSGSEFNAFIASIDTPSVYIFDEFEKMYSKKDQPNLLSLFDGVYTTKKLFILTINDVDQMNEFMRNRPGRIYYDIAYGGLSAEFIREFAEDRLTNKEAVERVVAYGMSFSQFNFDMLNAMCEELNRFPDTSFAECVSILNVKHDGSSPIYRLQAFDFNGNPKDGHYLGNYKRTRLLSGERVVEIYPIGENQTEKTLWYDRECIDVSLDIYAESTTKTPNLDKFTFRIPEYDVVIVATREADDRRPTLTDIL